MRAKAKKTKKINAVRKKKHLIAWSIVYYGQTYITENLSDAIVDIEDLEQGQYITISKIKMLKSEYDALPEFKGFY